MKKHIFEIKYNPVVKRGLFKVTDGTKSKSFRGVDEAEAKWKFCQHFKIEFEPGKLSSVELEKTIRQFPD